MFLDKAESFFYKGFRINYHDRGNGPVLIFLHGFGAAAYSWRYLAPALQERYRTIVFDLKGFGNSDRPEDDHYSIYDQADIITDFIRRNDLTDVCLIGHSMGGAVASSTCVKLLEEQADEHRVNRMILIGSAGYKQSLPFYMAALKLPLAEFVFPALVSASKVRFFLNFMFFDKSRITDELVEAYTGFLSKPGTGHALAMTIKRIIPPDADDIADKYARIAIPVTLIWGMNDSIVPLEIGERLHRDFPDSTLITLPSCGHVPQEECPEQTIDIVKAALQ